LRSHRAVPCSGLPAPGCCPLSSRLGRLREKATGAGPDSRRRIGRGSIGLFDDRPADQGNGEPTRAPSQAAPGQVNAALCGRDGDVLTRRSRTGFRRHRTPGTSRGHPARAAPHRLGLLATAADSNAVWVAAASSVAEPDAGLNPPASDSPLTGWPRVTAVTSVSSVTNLDELLSQQPRNVIPHIWWSNRQSWPLGSTSCRSARQRRPRRAERDDMPEGVAGRWVMTHDPRVPSSSTSA
jgi:hypothetical protein